MVEKENEIRKHSYALGLNLGNTYLNCIIHELCPI